MVFVQTIFISEAVFDGLSDLFLPLGVDGTNLNLEDLDLTISDLLAPGALLLVLLIGILLTVVELTQLLRLILQLFQAFLDRVNFLNRSVHLGGVQLLEVNERLEEGGEFNGFLLVGLQL